MQKEQLQCSANFSSSTLNLNMYKSYVYMISVYLYQTHPVHCSNQVYIHNTVYYRGYILEGIKPEVVPEPCWYRSDVSSLHTPDKGSHITIKLSQSTLGRNETWRQTQSTLGDAQCLCTFNDQEYSYNFFFFLHCLCRSIGAIHPIKHT